MPALTRRRDPDIPQECWRVYYRDVHVGTISRCVGNPGAAPSGSGAAGFIPAVGRGNARVVPLPTSIGPAPTSRPRGGSSSRSAPRQTFRRGAISAIGRQRNTVASIEESGCQWVRPFDLEQTPEHGIDSLIPGIFPLPTQGDQPSHNRVGRPRWPPSAGPFY
jgi:hypothetical protein